MIRFRFRLRLRNTVQSTVFFVSLPINGLASSWTIRWARDILSSEYCAQRIFWAADMLSCEYSSLRTFWVRYSSEQWKILSYEYSKRRVFCVRDILTYGTGTCILSYGYSSLGDCGHLDSGHWSDSPPGTVSLRKLTSKYLKRYLTIESVTVTFSYRLESFNFKSFSCSKSLRS